MIKRCLLVLDIRRGILNILFCLCLLLVGLMLVSSVSSGGSSDFGIDVSHHNGKIDWATVKKYNNIQFVYVKATEGATNTDKRYKYNITNASNNGFKVGSYHYFRMTSSAHAQYKNFISAIDSIHQDLIPMVDVETRDGRPVKEVRDSLDVFIRLVKQHFGKAPMIYGTNRSYNEICGSDYNKYHLYIGRYGKNKPVIKGKGSYTIWQYSESGKIKGIPKPVDLARFNPKYSIKSISL